MPKKKTVTVDNDTPIFIACDFKVVSIALDKNSNLYGLTDNNKVVKYNHTTKTWELL